MRRDRRTPWLLVGLVACLAACVPVTVNITFPQEKLEGAAGRIEDMVRSPENPTPPAPAPKASPGAAVDRILALVFPRDAEAQGVPDVKIQTPPLMRAIGSRRDRFPKLSGWMARGCVGENNQGLLEARPGQGCGGEIGALIGAENADRQYIYSELMRQNNIPAGDAGRVHAAFAKANRDRARPGEWVQLESGQWVKK